MRNKIFIILVFIFLINLFFRIYSYRNEYMSRFNSVYWEKRYELSQWSPKEACRNLDPHVNPKTCQWDDAWYNANKNADESILKKTSLGDDGLYTYVGWKYIHGNDPTLLNAEIPPLGKYLIGLSIIVFSNQNVFALLSGIFVLIAYYFLNKIIFKDKLLAFIPLFIFSFDPLFYTQIRAPFLDLLHLGFLLLTLIFFLKKRFLIAAIFLGCMISTKATASTFIIVVFTMLAYLLYVRDLRQVKNFLLSLPISLGVFLLTYAVYFFKGHSLIEFFGVQKWILNFYAGGAKGDPTSAFQILLIGNWPTWWGEIQRVQEWSILWSISLIACLYYFYKMVLRYKKHDTIIFAFWIIIYLLFLAFIPVWPRYLLLILPFMYTLSVWVFSRKIH